MSNKPKINKVLSELNCPKCGDQFERRSHRTIGPKQLKAEYYFSEWDYCRQCRHIQHYEKYKVYKDSLARENFNSWEEEQGKLDFIKNLS